MRVLHSANILTHCLMISPLHPPPFLVGHLAVPVQIPGVEGGLIRVSIAGVDVSVIILKCFHISSALYCIHLNLQYKPWSLST